MTDNPTQDIYRWLENHEIFFTRHDHVPVYTVEEADAIEGTIPGIKAKTLLVRGEKTKQLYLVSLEGHKKLEQSRLKEIIGERVRFADADNLEQILRVTPGSVSPLGLIFDTKHAIYSYIVDTDILASDIVTWHPNKNDQTLEFSQEMFQHILSLLPHTTINY